MADSCWEDRATKAPRKELTWRDLDHHGFDPEWGAAARYVVHVTSMRRRVPRVVTRGRTWEEAKTLAEALNAKVRRKAFGGRIYWVKLESPSSYADFCAARRARADVA